jgi:high affinity Mn2+ porin
MTSLRRAGSTAGLSAAFYFAAAVAGAAVVAWAAPAAEPIPDTPLAESFAVHGQFTYVEQESSNFYAPYAGPNSLSPGRGAETMDATLYLGKRLWPGAEAWINGEIDQGFGLDDTLGAAGFPSGEAYKIGKNQPYLRLPRLFVRQTLSEGEASLEGTRQADAPATVAAANQLGGVHQGNRVVITVGKFSVGDVFDTNQYAHDPRSDFLNWAVIDAGSFDYAADAWGYTAGAAVEWYCNAWTLRGGLFDLSNVPNSAHLDPGFHEFQSILEIERRHRIAGRPGKLMLTVFESRARMGLLDDAVRQAETSGSPVNIAAVRSYRTRGGASLNFEQQLTVDMGAFARLGKAAGNVEPYEFTDIDRTVSAGLSLLGTAWHRTDDTLGVAAINNGISAARERYLNAGGLGVLIGDGRLPHPGPEQILEGYYSLSVFKAAHLAFDYQWINHPAYNRDRGPVSVVAVRVHAQF